MKIYATLGLLLTLILIAQPNNLPAANESNFSSEDRSLTPESIGRRLRELLDRLKENFSFEISAEDRAPISLMLRNRERLGLTADQVKHLEQLRSDFAPRVDSKRGKSSHRRIGSDQFARGATRRHATSRGQDPRYRTDSRRFADRAHSFDRKRKSAVER